MIWGGMDKFPFPNPTVANTGTLDYTRPPMSCISYLDLLPLCFYRLPQFLPRDTSSKSTTEDLPDVKSLTPLVSNSRFRFY